MQAKLKPVLENNLFLGVRCCNFQLDFGRQGSLTDVTVLSCSSDHRETEGAFRGKLERPHMEPGRAIRHPTCLLTRR